jgi:hypothetical protein
MSAVKFFNPALHSTLTLFLLIARYAIAPATMVSGGRPLLALDL